MIEPLSAAVVLERYFPEARAKLLDVAAILDRIERGGGMAGDPRMEKILSALRVLQASNADRAQRLQELFSLTYQPEWERPMTTGRGGKVK